MPVKLNQKAPLLIHFSLMESLSRSHHRRKLSNVNSFTGKNAYDGVFSGHRPKFDGAPTVNVAEYREIFSTADSSIPVLDLSVLDESCDELSIKPDYCKIFGGFRDLDIAVSYEQLVARDKVRAPSSTSQSSQDLDDLSCQSSDALKQFNLSYNKISQRSKDGLDGTTHVTQLHAVPGFTCFIDESASQLNKETVKKNSPSTINVNVKSSKQDFIEKPTSQTSVEFRSRNQEESLSDDINFKTFEVDFNSHPSKVSSSQESKKEIKKQKSLETNSIPLSPPAASHPKKETEKLEESLSDDRNFKTFEVDFKSLPSKVLSSPESKKVTEKPKSPEINNIPSSQPAASQPKKEYEKQEESLFDDWNCKTFEVPSKVLSSPESKKEPEKKISPATNNIPSSLPAASQPKKETEKQKTSVTNDVHPREKVDIPEKQTSRTAVESQSTNSQGESFSDDRNVKPFQTDFRSYPSKVLSPPEASQPKKETEKQKSSVTNTVRPIEKVDIPVKQTSRTAVESQSRHDQDESFSDVRNFKPFQTDFKSYPSKVSSSSSSPAASTTHLDDHKDHQKRSSATNQEFPSTFVDEELDVNSAAAASTAALRKAIEKAQESIRIAKESVGRRKEGVKVFSSKSFKHSLKVKTRVANVNAGEEPNEKDYKMKEMDHKNGIPVTFKDFAVGEKLFDNKKVENEIHVKISESVKKSEIPIRSPFELNNDKMICNSKQVVGITETKLIESNTCEDPQKDSERFLVLESCEKKLGGTESNNLTVCQKMETQKDASQKFDQNGCEKNFNEESFGLLENNMHENLEQEHDEEVASAERQDKDERQVKEDGGTENHSEEENFYDVFDVEMVKNTQTYASSIEAKDLSQKEVYENCKAGETCENSSSDYDDAEENENVLGVNNIVDDTEETVDQNNNNAESSQDIDDVSTCHEFQVEYKEAVKEETFENISSDETEDKGECEAESDNLENCMDFGQNGVQFESSVDTIHGLEIEVKEYKEEEDAVVKEENNLQQSHEQTPEVRIEMDTRTSQEPKDACREPEPSKLVHDKEERERERIKLAVDRAIREARERAFAEVRQRVIADTQEKITKASIDKISAQSKLKAERALVERATAEARQRALEKAMKISEPKTQTSSTSQTNTESALRSKAKLEKHNRIMERAAKALAEKEKRDLLAFREQAERNRLAEHLDADIKRWSTGKEGNLRALLSTLQYILGADSGWQPVSLTEIITTGAVKKAYRKATLCVHPDKLQQRGASIQQKYICEKVFDLLKAAWNRFNSEER
ncbi:hypothetical protein QVD17_25232 [Tagetes erecta]|uniref:J domain-containing protein n=1 Tax=Tagetes erecta TaxID=13708 RepID=A0AAD8NVA6_TARER|nr:hypothetical protein QVD17_25232 [Tagetes erecta]